MEYNPQRIPSYCDRVLWKSMPAWAHRLQQTSLLSVPEVSTSDHKPVVATFSLELSRSRALIQKEETLTGGKMLALPPELSGGTAAASERSGSMWGPDLRKLSGFSKHHTMSFSGLAQLRKQDDKVPPPHVAAPRDRPAWPPP